VGGLVTPAAVCYPRHSGEVHRFNVSFLYLKHLLPLKLANLAQKLRGPYNKPLREEAKRQIRKLAFEEGYTINEIKDQLNFPPRTFQRYVSEAFAEYRDALAKKLTDDEVLNQLAILEGRLSAQRRELLAIARNKGIDSMARIKAHTEAADMASTIYSIYRDTGDLIKYRGRLFASDRADDVRRRKEETQEEKKKNYNESLMHSTMKPTKMKI
jgi:hypothetical protein